MKKGLVDCKTDTPNTVTAGVAGSGPALPSAWPVEAGPGPCWALGGPAGHPGQPRLLQDPHSTLTAAQCRQGWAAKATQSLFIPELQLPRATATERGAEPHSFPSTPRVRGRDPHRQRHTVPLPRRGLSHPPAPPLTCLSQATWVLPPKTVFLQPHEGPGGFCTPDATEPTSSRKLCSFRKASCLHPIHFS